jgi:hypothetical protein
MTSSQEWNSGGGVGTLGVLEEGGVDRAAGVVEGDEHDPLAGPDRRRLGGDLHAGDEHLGLAAAATMSGARVTRIAARNGS